MKRYETFEKKYLPIERKDGTILFETYGKDLEQIKRTFPRKVWTLLDCDGKLVIGAGYHHVNRMNYIVSIRPWTDCNECYSY
jgi:hypothetical protein